MPWIRISAEQDTSLETFVDLYNKKYNKVRFEARPEACEVCQKLNGKTWTLRRFINTTRHSAPIFSHTHVNAKSPMIVYDSRGRKPEVSVYYDGTTDYGYDAQDDIQDEEMIEESLSGRKLKKKLFE